MISTDEKTGMQALQRLHETQPVRPGLVERVEFEYVWSSPANPFASVLYSRMLADTSERMRFFRQLQDTAGEDLIRDWILSPQTCN
jgi:hypothetical protein